MVVKFVVFVVDMQFKIAQLESTWQNTQGQVFKVIEQKELTTLLEMIYPEKKQMEVPNNTDFNVTLFRPKRAWGKVEGTRAKVIHEELAIGGTVDDLMIRVSKRTGDTNLTKVRRHITTRISYLRIAGMLEEKGDFYRSLEPLEKSDGKVLENHKNI